MDFVDTPAEAAFRAAVRAWLGEHLRGEFAALGVPFDGRGKLLAPVDRHYRWRHCVIACRRAGSCICRLE